MLTSSNVIQGNFSCSGVDYTVNGQSFQFGPTTEKLAVSLDIIEDMLVEGEENLIFSLTVPTVDVQIHSGAQLGAQPFTQIFINENDGKLYTLILMMVVEIFIGMLEIIMFM